MNLTDSNPYLRKQAQIEEARKKHDESEWRLGFLRSLEPEKPSQPNPNQLLEWNQKLLRGLN